MSFVILNGTSIISDCELLFLAWGSSSYGLPPFQAGLAWGHSGIKTWRASGTCRYCSRRSSVQQHVVELTE